MTTIGFFGDSFCADKNDEVLGLETYIEKLSKHYNADIVNLGHGGSSVWDLFLYQFNPKLRNNKVPDICVFVWTEHLRLFHRKVRNINHGSTFHEKHETNLGLWNAAKNFYNHLLDDEKHLYEYKNLLYYLDHEIFSKLEDKKIIHLWSFGEPLEWSEKGFTPNNINYHYRWKNGVEIRPPLICTSLSGIRYEEFVTKDCSNHFDTQEKNDFVFNLIKFSIDNYKKGMLINTPFKIDKI
jgi:hypothetical protein